MSKLLFDFQAKPSDDFDAIEPLLDWEDLVKATEAREALEKNRQQRNKREKGNNDA